MFYLQRLVSGAVSLAREFDSGPGSRILMGAT